MYAMYVQNGFENTTDRVLQFLGKTKNAIKTEGITRTG